MAGLLTWWVRILVSMYVVHYCSSSTSLLLLQGRRSHCASLYILQDVVRGKHRLCPKENA